MRTRGTVAASPAMIANASCAGPSAGSAAFGMKWSAYQSPS
jgi:hypothetical protein